MNLFPKDFASECRVCGLVFKNFRKMFEHQKQIHPQTRRDEF